MLEIGLYQKIFFLSREKSRELRIWNYIERSDKSARSLAKGIEFKISLNLPVLYEGLQLRTNVILAET